MAATRRDATAPRTLKGKVVWNGDKQTRSDDFVVKFRVRVRTTPFGRDELVAFEKWAVGAVWRWEQAAYPGLDPRESAFRVVFDFASSLCGDEEEWKFDENSDPAVYMLVHFDRATTPPSTKDGMCIRLRRDPPRMTPQGLATYLMRAQEAPAWIEKVGVSAVSKDLMVEQWWRCITFHGEEAKKDRWGFPRGYMLHAMWVAWSGEPSTEREMSFAFSRWPEYKVDDPGALGWL